MQSDGWKQCHPPSSGMRCDGWRLRPARTFPVNCASSVSNCDWRQRLWVVVCARTRRLRRGLRTPLQRRLSAQAAPWHQQRPGIGQALRSTPPYPLGAWHRPPSAAAADGTGAKLRRRHKVPSFRCAHALPRTGHRRSQAFRQACKTLCLWPTLPGSAGAAYAQDHL